MTTPNKLMIEAVAKAIWENTPSPRDGSMNNKWSRLASLTEILPFYRPQPLSKPCNHTRIREMLNDLTVEEKISRMMFVLGDDGFRKWVDLMLLAIEGIYSNKHSETGLGSPVKYTDGTDSREYDEQPKKSEARDWNCQCGWPHKQCGSHYDQTEPPFVEGLCGRYQLPYTKTSDDKK